jgi:glutaminyl-peptide cyclotransferase
VRSSALLLALLAVSQAVFRSATDAVLVDVSVMRDGRPVTGLAAGVFELTDNGVRQELVDLVAEQLPLDLSVHIDVSGSMSAPQRAVVEEAVRAVKGALRPSDTMAVTVFGSHIAAADMGDAAFTIPARQLRRGTSVRDALLLALASPSRIERRQLTILMSDGDDSASFYDQATVTETARYAAGPVWVVLVPGAAKRLRPEDDLLQAVADATGGGVMRLKARTDVATAFAQVLEGFRASYVLRYTPRGVAGDGWHDLRVTAKGAGLTVRARQGYWRGARQDTERAPVRGYTIVARYPHDPQAFTQGLTYADGRLYEGTGKNGQSVARISELASGLTVAEAPLDRAFFGEGLTVLGDRVFQITWQSQTGFVYDRQLRKIGGFTYPGEGWGLTHDGTHLIMSDGSAVLRFFDPSTFQEVRRVTVTAENVPVKSLNELEWIEGEIWANVWGKERVARISPADGRVVSWIDFSGLRPASTRGKSESVLNGIAYDAAARRILVTGKNWPEIFHITLK